MSKLSYEEKKQYIYNNLRILQKNIDNLRGITDKDEYDYKNKEIYNNMILEKRYIKNMLENDKYVQAKYDNELYKLIKLFNYNRQLHMKIQTIREGKETESEEEREEEKEKEEKNRNKPVKIGRFTIQDIDD